MADSGNTAVCEYFYEQTGNIASEKVIDDTALEGCCRHGVIITTP